MYAVQQWRCFFEGVKAGKIARVTSHHPPTLFQTHGNLSRREARGSEYLQISMFRRQCRPRRYKWQMALAGCHSRVGPGQLQSPKRTGLKEILRVCQLLCR